MGFCLKKDCNTSAPEVICRLLSLCKELNVSIYWNFYYSMKINKLIIRRSQGRIGTKGLNIYKIINQSYPSTVWIYMKIKKCFKYHYRASYYNSKASVFTTNLKISLVLKLQKNWVWWCTPVISALGKLRQKDPKLRASLGYMVRPFS
jgi:hypothetical protein